MKCECGSEDFHHAHVTCIGFVEYDGLICSKCGKGELKGIFDKLKIG